MAMRNIARNSRWLAGRRLLALLLRPALAGYAGSAAALLLPYAGCCCRLAAGQRCCALAWRYAMWWRRAVILTLSFHEEMFYGHDDHGSPPPSPQVEALCGLVPARVRVLHNIDCQMHA